MNAGTCLRRLLVTACALAAPAAAHATPLPLDLTWEAPPDCPSATAVRAELERVVRVRRGRTPPRLTARAQIEQHDGRWHLRLQTLRDNVAGERRLEASSCASLVGAATLVMGLAFGEGVEISADSLVVEPRPEPRPAPARPRPDSPAPVAAAPASPPPPPPAPVEERPPPPPPPPSPSPPQEEAPPVITRAPPVPAPSAPLVWSLSVAGRSTWGPFPNQAFGFAAGLDVGGRRWFASLRGNVSPWAENAVASDAAARFAAFGGSLSSCVRGALAYGISVAGCAGLQLTVVRSSSVGTSDPMTALAPVYAALPAVRVAVPLFRAVSAQLGVELATSLNRPAFEVKMLGDVHRVPRLIPGVSLGLAVEL